MEKRTGTIEDLKRDIENSGFHEQPPLETVVARTRMQIDDALTKILAESGLPLFLFDYLITSVQNDIRKADLDMMRVGQEGVKDGDTE